MRDINADRPGYYRTKLGWIPNVWSVTRLDSLTRRETGHTPDQTMQDYWNGGRKWVSLADSGRLDTTCLTETEKQISDLGIKNSSARLLPAGTVILLRDASVGLVAIIEEEMAVSQHFVAWICGENLHNRFLYYWLLADRRKFQRMAVGTTIVTIGLPFFAKYEVPLPSFEEQVKIAKTLSACDWAINKTGAMIAAKKQQKKALMQQLLTGKKRLPGFKGEWLILKFFDVFERVMRRNTDNCQNNLSISGSRGLISQEDYFSKRIAAKDVSGYYLLKRGELAYNKSYSDGYPLGAIKMLEGYDEGVVSTLYICFCLKPGSANSKFVRHFFESAEFNRELYSIAQEGARNHGLLNVSPQDFFNTKLYFPSIDEQRAIAKILDSAEAVVSSWEAKFCALKQQKKALMEKLLTGHIRVKV
ncbi:MAG: restriction endonuclease subunit S [Opitutaceae bacterium]|jgi:type I restriction enzyme S subunit